MDIPLNLAAFNSTSIMFNSTIRITDDGSGSSIRNLVFNNTVGSSYTVPICIDEASDNVISNNVILLSFNENSYPNIVGMYVCGESLNNEISFNRIAVTSTNSYSKHYAYGIELSKMLFNSNLFSRFSPSHNRIVGNAIEVTGDYYSNGIYSTNAINTYICDNEIILNATNLAYGIISEYFDTIGDDTSAYNITISNNVINAHSSMVYDIEVFRCNDIQIMSNTIVSSGDAVYGIAAYETYGVVVYDNDILVNGSDAGKVSDNFDAITTGHNAIVLMKNTHDIAIVGNRILSYYDLGGDYAIRLDSSCKDIIITDNRMSSNNDTLIGDDSVIGDAYKYNNTAYSPDNINVVNYTLVDIYVDASNVNGNGSFDNPFTSINDALLYLKSLIIADGNINYKGIVHVANGTYTGFGRNLGLYVSGLNVEIIGDSYNSTFIKSTSSNTFFEISDDCEVLIKNITFVNGLLRKNYAGLIVNRGSLSLEDCIFENSRLVATSAIVYNYGDLRLSGNIMQLSSPNGHYIHNKGKIDNLILNFLGDSISEEDRTLVVNVSNVKLIAYLHDDMGNPVSGGSVKFAIQGREFAGSFNVDKGVSSFDAILSLNGNFRVTGRYLDSLTNTFVNIGYIKSSVIMDDAVFYVSNDGSDDEGDGSFDSPFKTVAHALSLADVIVDHFTIKLMEGSYELPLKDINVPYGLTVSGVKDKTFITSDCIINTPSVVELNNLVFNKVMINNSIATLTVNNCYFTDAEISAIYSRNANLTVIGCTFVDNGFADYHKSYGGGTVVPESMEEFNLGGAIHNIGGKLTVISSNFNNNEAVFGGAIYNNQSDLYISGSNFTSNLAHIGLNEVISRSFGGAIYQFLGRRVVISDCIFDDNYANGFGGAFYSSGSQPCANDYGYNVLYGDWYHSNLPYSFQEIYFINCIFNKNIAPLGGGGTYVMDNIFTQYIGCKFFDNVVYTYDPSTIESTHIGSYKTSPDLYFSEQMNLGGAINDKNLLIIDSSFKSNSFDSGGALILPTTDFRDFLIDHHYKPRFENYGDGGQEIYVADSSLLTGDDSIYLGIGGWKGSYDGPSISKYISEYYENINPYNPSGNNNGNNGNGDNGDSGSGSGKGTSGGNDDSGNGNGNGNSNSSSGSSESNKNGYLSLNDIYNMLGQYTNIVTNNGNLISINDLLNELNQYPNDIVENTSDSDNIVKNDEIILVNGSDDDFSENSGGNIANNGEIVSVGESSDPLTGIIDADSSISQSDSNDDSQESSNVNPLSSTPSDSKNAYEISKDDVSKDIDVVDNSVIFTVFFVLLFVLLLIVGYYRNKSDDD
ncbi:hypothetical protein [Methanobrevibacter sp.]|uniref:hypothetical protein n=1 Tax=Methanobrevibacter sp. TaxID=66852 RepID=UPI00388E8CD5